MVSSLGDIYQLYVPSPVTQNVVQLRNVFQGKAQLESQLQEKAEESFQAYQQIALLLEEKKVVMDIIQQLSVEAGKQIDIL